MGRGEDTVISEANVEVGSSQETTFSSMEWMHVVISIAMKLLLSKSDTYNFKARDIAKFRCTTEEVNNPTDRIRLYLHLEELKVSCNLYFQDEYNEDVLNIRVPLYTSVGLIPSMEIFNRTSISIFYFEK
uniref:cation channel sperm-associated auxiliary subunit beta-like n=1 Tax=Pristiophorus japonicus TaxID=55135 RepID=UPI00398F1FDD